MLRFEIQRKGNGKIAPVGGNLYFTYEEVFVQKMKLRRRVCCYLRRQNLS